MLSSPGRGLLLALAITQAASLQAQSISGRVVDSAGAPIPGVRVLVNPAGDTTDSRVRIAVTNERGVFTFALKERGVYEVSAVRIGLRPLPRRLADVRAGDVRLDLIMNTLPLTLGTVAVVGRANFSCLSLDDPKQSPRVREWVHYVQELVRSRRAIEREYAYSVRDVFTTSGRRVDRTIVQHPDDSSHIAEIPGWWLETGRWRRDPVATVAAGRSFWIWPDEGAILRPSFSAGQCFDTTFTRVSRTEYQIRFRPLAGGETNFAGSLRVDSAGFMTRVMFEHVTAKQERLFGATLFYERIQLDGMAFPFVTRVTDTYGPGTDRRFTYSKFRRASDSVPRPPLVVVARMNQRVRKHF